jgi:hypothetical protein
VASGASVGRAVRACQPAGDLILPLLPPFTVRDGIGFGVDTAANPLAYYTPFVWDGVGLRAGDTVNDRSLGHRALPGLREKVSSTCTAPSATRICAVASSGSGSERPPPAWSRPSDCVIGMALSRHDYALQ